MESRSSPRPPSSRRPPCVSTSLHRDKTLRTTKSVKEEWGSLSVEGEKDRGGTPYSVRRREELRYRQDGSGTSPVRVGSFV